MKIFFLNFWIWFNLNNINILTKWSIELIRCTVKCGWNNKDNLPCLLLKNYAKNFQKHCNKKVLKNQEI